MLTAVADPRDRFAEAARRLHDERIFAIHHVLGAEAAADVLGDDAQLLRWQLQDHVAQDHLDDVHALAAKFERDLAGRLVDVGAGRARLHVIGDDARVDDLEARLARGGRENRVGLGLVADMRVIGDISGRAVEQPRRAGPHGLLHVDERGQRLPFDRRRLDGVAGLGGGLRDDHRDNVADMIDLGPGDDGIRLQRRLRAVGVLNRRQARQPAETFKVLGRIDRAHARHGANRGQIAYRETGAAIGAAHEGRLQRRPVAGVRRIAALPGDQPHVLDALHALTSAEFSYAHSQTSRFDRYAHTAPTELRHEICLRSRRLVKGSLTRRTDNCRIVFIGN